ncbi:MAG: nickel pincer cofactor biosynthesis protein LarB [Coriobacteriales bacterium]|nr:nickel pincer cofactor biosynthesis protein LarB [Coriobacteriales bacterium]
MDRDRILELLSAVAQGQLTPEGAAADLAKMPFAETASAEAGHTDARVDHHRALRCGFPEVVFCQGKTPDQVRSIAREILDKSDVLLATRASAAHFQGIARIEPDARYFEEARLIVADRRKERPSHGRVVVATGGTSDTPIAEEASISAEVMGLGVTRLYDVGVAGVHRLLAHRDVLESADVIIAVAGMEGALPSLVAGLVSVPVVAVPTSVGYGAHFGGVAPLLTMLNSCASGVGVMNIDNGFGAASLAHRIVLGRGAPA